MMDVLLVAFITCLQRLNLIIHVGIALPGEINDGHLDMHLIVALSTSFSHLCWPSTR
eukprot:m.2436 g.2436  ORF g.2436 m.2436 type:complete len:57 (+) comp2955_c0_seq1:237-407(+)